MAAAATRSKTNIFLIGSTTNKVTGARLPSASQALQLFFYFHTDLKLTVRESSANAIDLILPFWENSW